MKIIQSNQNKSGRGINDQFASDDENYDVPTIKLHNA